MPHSTWTPAFSSLPSSADQSGRLESPHTPARAPVVLTGLLQDSGGSLPFLAQTGGGGVRGPAAKRVGAGGRDLGPQTMYRDWGLLPRGPPRAGTRGKRAALALAWPQ